MSAPDPLDRALAALPPAPPAPPFEAVLARLPAASRARGSRRALRILVGGAAVAAAAGFGALWLRSPDRVGADAVRVASLTGGVRVLRYGSAVPAGGARAGDVLEASRPSRVRVGDRATVLLGSGARVSLVSALEVELAAGTAEFDVVHDEAAPFQVRVAGFRVRDAGTRFVLARRDDAPLERVEGAVLEGEVDVAGRRLRAGEGFVLLAGTPGVASVADLSVPAAWLELDGEARAGEPVRVQLALRNASPFPVPTPTFDDLLAPLFVEVVDPAGAARTVRVTRDALVDPDGAEPWLETATGVRAAGRPVASLRLAVRFASLFPTPGTYRLRAVRSPLPGSPEATTPVLVVDAR